MYDSHDDVYSDADFILILKLIENNYYMFLHDVNLYRYGGSIKSLRSSVCKTINFILSNQFCNSSLKCFSIMYIHESSGFDLSSMSLMSLYADIALLSNSKLDSSIIVVLMKSSDMFKMVLYDLGVRRYVIAKSNGKYGMRIYNSRLFNVSDDISIDTFYIHAVISRYLPNMYDVRFHSTYNKCSLYFTIKRLFLF